MTLDRTTRTEVPGPELSVTELDRAVGGALYHWDELLTVVARPRAETGVRQTRG